jgi:microcystin-dependent protein
MSDQYLGEIRMFAGNFAPNGWSLCNGQLMSISQNSALFSILGTTYGGDGITTFGLPNLQGTVPVHQGTARSGSSYQIGQAAGTENVTLLTTNMPSHNHLVGVTNQPGTQVDPTNALIAETNTGDSRNPITTTLNYAPAPSTGTMAPTAVAMAGGSVPHSNMQPYLAITFIISLVGIYPSRA